MDALWLILMTAGLMLVYVIVLVRASLRGEQWARDTLEAVAYLAEGPAAVSPRLVEEREAGAGLEAGAAEAELVA